MNGGTDSGYTFFWKLLLKGLISFPKNISTVEKICGISNLYYYIKKNLGNFKRWISFSARFEGCRPPRNANKGSMDRLFDVDGHGPKKSRILDQPDEKIQFEIFDKLSWPQLLTNFYEILTSCLPS